MKNRQKCRIIKEMKNAIIITHTKITFYTCNKKSTTTLCMLYQINFKKMGTFLFRNLTYCIKYLIPGFFNLKGTLLCKKAWQIRDSQESKRWSQIGSEKY